ncbi:MAG: hypothetical protein IT372_28480 [Polyangiaceae bacterium]|nr:hypothetical protein [Polyangiaceae bacterium]
MRAFLLGALALGIAAAAGGSCTLDADGTAPTLNGPGTTSGSGGDGGVHNPGTPCVDRAECPADAACVAYACNNGHCTPSFLPAGTEVAGSIQGDCRRVTCSASGTPTEQPDPADVPAGDDCNVGSCNGTTPVLTPRPNDSACGAGGLLRCLNGVCVGCIDASDCVAPPCFDPVCNGNNECGTTPVAAGAELADASSTDCTHQECDGAGNVVVAADPNDVPDDTVDCTNDSCNGTIPQHLPKADGAACSSNGGAHCYQGVCSQCGLPANCPDPACKAPTCNGTCGLTNDPDGAACGSGQYCYQGACSQCAVDANCPAPAGCVASYTCTAGTCAPTYVADGTDCGGGNKCYGGQCVQCGTVADCPAPPDCKVAACVNNTCQTSNASDTSACQSNRICCGGVCCGGGVSTCSGGACP